MQPNHQEKDFGFGEFPDATVETFNHIYGINDLTDLQWKLEVTGHWFSVIFPAGNGIAILTSLFLAEVIQCIPGIIAVYPAIDFLQVSSRKFAFFPRYIFTDVQYLMDHEELGNG
ncbi:hypothetical protein OQX62_18485 [Pedobacter sp. MR2016-24]|nr:hypothetical protein [Pedobacter sp. MR2016-24]MCX2485497.1 hypothetical protein [Pedobacter sp. MR2016-24]